MERSNLATISSVVIALEEHGCLTIGITFHYEEGGSVQVGGGHNYGHENSEPTPAFGRTIAALVSLYGNMNKVDGQKVEVIKDAKGFAVGFRPLFMGRKCPDFIFANFITPKP